MLLFFIVMKIISQCKICFNGLDCLWTEYNVWCFMSLCWQACLQHLTHTHTHTPVISSGRAADCSLDSMCLLWKRMTRGNTFSLCVCVCVCVSWLDGGVVNCRFESDWITGHTHRMMYLCDYVGGVTVEGNTHVCVYVCVCAGLVWYLKIKLFQHEPQASHVHTAVTKPSLIYSSDHHIKPAAWTEHTEGTGGIHRVITGD